MERKASGIFDLLNNVCSLAGASQRQGSSASRPGKSRCVISLSPVPWDTRSSDPPITGPVRIKLRSQDHVLQLPVELPTGTSIHAGPDEA